jgi:hypothetical protein
MYELLGEELLLPDVDELLLARIDELLQWVIVCLAFSRMRQGAGTYGELA